MWGRRRKDEPPAERTPLRFRSLVVGVDEGPSSLVAVRWAAELARLHEAKLHVVCAGEARSGPGSLAASPEDLDAEMLQEKALDPEAAAARALFELKSQGVLATSEVDSGSPVEAILRAVRSQDADLVLIGSHGHGRPAFKAATGIAQGIKNEVAAHVLIARGEPPPARILVGTDGSLQAARAVQAATDLALAWHVPLSAVEVGPSAGPGAGGVAVPPGLPSGSDATHLVGNPSQELVLEARRRGAGLLVLGGRGSGGQAALSLGSVSDRVSVYADTSVLIIKALVD